MFREIASLALTGALASGEGQGAEGDGRAVSSSKSSRGCRSSRGFLRSHGRTSRLAMTAKGLFRGSDFLLSF